MWFWVSTIFSSDLGQVILTLQTSISTIIKLWKHTLWRSHKSTANICHIITKCQALKEGSESINSFWALQQHHEGCLVPSSCRWGKQSTERIFLKRKLVQEAWDAVWTWPAWVTADHYTLLPSWHLARSFYYLERQEHVVYCSTQHNPCSLHKCSWIYLSVCWEAFCGSPVTRYFCKIQLEEPKPR